jgi:hypothetical protein
MQSRAFAKALSQGGSVIWPPARSSSINGTFPSSTTLRTTIQPVKLGAKIMLASTLLLFDWQALLAAVFVVIAFVWIHFVFTS